MPRPKSRNPNYKPSLRERFDNYVLPRFFGRHMEEMVNMVDIFEDAYDRGGLLMPPEKVIQQLKESGQLVDLIMRTRGRAFGVSHQLSEMDRDAAISYATYMFQTNVNIERAVRMWTDFGLGQRVDIRSADETADTVLDEFWNAIRNSSIIGQRHLHERSEDALNEGELALIFWYSTVDGQATVRRMSTKGLKVIWDDPVDKTVPIMYVRDLGDRQIAYRDWRTETDQFEDALDKLNGPVSADRFVPTIIVDGEDIPVTQHVVLWASRNRNSILGRGMPQFNNGLEWARVLQDFMGDRAAVARKAAMYTEKVRIDGGSRELDKFKNRAEGGGAQDYAQSIVSPAASDWLENTGVVREWMNRNTGATSARYDGRMLAGQLSVSTGIGLHWMGFPDALANRSTAEEILRPFWQQIERYQVWWISVLEDVGRIVLKLKDEYSAIAVNSDVKISVTLETPLSVEVQLIVSLLKETREQISSGIVPADIGRDVVRELTLMALDKVGLRDPQGVYRPTSDEGELDATQQAELTQTVLDNWKAGLLEDRAVVDYLSNQLNV